MVFGILLVIDFVVLALIAGFFLIGLADGSVSSFNMLLWLLVLVVPTAVVLGGWRLKARGQGRAASVVLALLAVPAALAGLFFLLLILGPGRWN